MKAKKRIDFEKMFYAVCAIACFFLFWWFITAYTPAGETTPGPIEVIRLLIDSFFEPIGNYVITGHLLVSLRRVLVGFFVATILGIILGIGMGTSKWAEAIFKPVFELLRPIPPIAWISLVILFFGIGEISKYILCGIGAFTNVTLNAYTGARNVDQELVGCARMLGTSERAIFFRVVLPSCTPQIFAGMQVALSTSWMEVLAAEMVGAQEGCGWMIQRGSDTLNITLVMVGMIVIGAVGMLLAAIMRVIERRLCSWNVMHN